MPTADPPKRRYAARQPREVRREQILDATLRLIARDGWAGMTMDRIAEEAGVAKSVTYAIFQSQAGLQRALMEREQERTFALSAAGLAAARAQDSPTAAIAAAFAVFLDGVARAPDSWKLVLLAIDGAPDSVRDAIRAGRERWRCEIRAVAEERLRPLGVDQGDADVLAHVLRGNIEYLARLIIEQPETYTPERIVAAIGRVAQHIAITIA